MRSQGIAGETLLFKMNSYGPHSLSLSLSERIRVTWAALEARWTDKLEKITRVVCTVSRVGLRRRDGPTGNFASPGSLKLQYQTETRAGEWIKYPRRFFFPLGIDRRSRFVSLVRGKLKFPANDKSNYLLLARFFHWLPRILFKLHGKKLEEQGGRCNAQENAFVICSKDRT